MDGLDVTIELTSIERDTLLLIKASAADALLTGPCGWGQVNAHIPWKVELIWNTTMSALHLSPINQKLK